MRLRIATLVCLVNCVMSSGYAQEGEKTQRPKSNEQLRELANPGPEHRELAKRYTRTEQINLTAEQLRSLRSLGYIQ